MAWAHLAPELFKCLIAYLSRDDISSCALVCAQWKKCVDEQIAELRVGADTLVRDMCCRILCMFCQQNCTGSSRYVAVWPACLATVGAEKALQHAEVAVALTPSESAHYRHKFARASLCLHNSHENLHCSARVTHGATFSNAGIARSMGHSCQKWVCRCKGQAAESCPSRCSCCASSVPAGCALPRYTTPMA